ncbi:MAG: type II toxin-antitoxin system VapC family toxin [Aeromicrobium sp.]|uniref:type II toxin-antitoxin system VapC family toxin n=1 Tax=Aeromicrobium sp. TaxID=1871063 RepID=UPI0039E5511D
MGVTYLLDTHVLLWLLGQPDRVPAEARRVLSDRKNRLFVSAICGFEVSTKVRLGKLDAAPLVAAWPARIADLGAEELAVTSAHAVLAGSLDWAHRDPFDRLLVAQAMTDGLTLVTVDAAITQLPGVRLLTW